MTVTRNRRKSPAGRRSRKVPTVGAPDTAAPAGWPTSKLWLAASAAAVVVLAGGLAFHALTGDRSDARPGGARADSAAPAAFVGSEACAGCHRAEAELWRPSQHKRAMQHATEKSVLGDFNDARFDYHGVPSRFFRKDGRFFVETDGPDGKLATFEVKYTFGVDPLQQYLIAFPDGRLQALVDRLGQPTEGQRRPALVPPLSQ